MIEQLNKIFDSRVRLGIMSLLMIHEQADYNFLKKTLELTDGNLASHLTALEKAQYLSIQKAFVGRKTQTTYLATSLGKAAFAEHLTALERIIQEMKIK